MKGYPRLRIGNLALSSDFKNFHGTLLGAQKKFSSAKTTPAPQPPPPVWQEDAFFSLKNRIESVFMLEN